MIRSWVSCVYTCNDSVLAFTSLVWPWKIRCSLAPEMNKSKKVSILHHTSRSLPLTSDTRKQLSLSRSLWKTLYTCRPGSCIWSWSIQVLMKTDHTTRRQKHQTNLNTLVRADLHPNPVWRGGTQEVAPTFRMRGTMLHFASPSSQEVVQTATREWPTLGIHWGLSLTKGSIDCCWGRKSQPDLNMIQLDFVDNSMAILKAPNSAVNCIFSLPPVERRCLRFRVKRFLCLWGEVAHTLWWLDDRADIF